MKAKMSIAVILVIVIGLLVLPPLISKATGKNQDQIIMQVENSHAVVNGELTQMTDNDGNPLTVSIVSGRTVAPLRWIAENLGLTVEWDNATQTITLSTEQKKDDVVSLVIGQTAMTVEEDTVTLDAPATLIHNVTYVPVRAIGEAFGWNLQFVDAKEGGLIFLDNKRKAKEPSATEIKNATNVLGPTREQITADGAIFRAGSDYALTSAGQVQMTAEDNTPVTVVHEESDTVTWMPVSQAAVLLGASTAITEKACELTLENGSKVSIPRTDNEDVKTIDGVVYTTVETLAKTMGVFAAETEDNIVVLTKTFDLTEFSDQMAWVQAQGKALPDKLNIPKAEHYIALTFDDGPTGGSEGLTVRLLNGLKERGAHATFFMCGYRINDFHTHMERYLAEGHQLGNHTYNHPGLLTKYTADKVYQQFEDNSLLIQSYCGERPIVGRPVGGDYDDMVLEQMKKAGLAAINWSVDTLDWKYRDAARIKNVIVTQAKDGDIVLMHDLHQPTVDGVLAAIDELKQQGYAFVTVSELAQVEGVKLEAGKLYTCFNEKAK